jgi:hypothetical protein
MVHNKKLGAGLALIAGLLGLGAAGSASALPEMQVGTLPPIVAPQALVTADSTAAEPESEDVAVQDTAS